MVIVIAMVDQEWLENPIDLFISLPAPFILLVNVQLTKYCFVFYK